MEFITTVMGGAIFVIGVIAGIGPQNLNTMSHAICRNHEYTVATTCFLADVVLILLGCLGLQFMAAQWLLIVVHLVGIVFLAYYLWGKLEALNKPRHIRFTPVVIDKKAAILRALGLTWLNPLVFIDTLIVIGGASTHYQGWANVAFILGAILGDFIWLFGLTLIARTFAAKLNRPSVWLVLDVATIVLVAYILIRMVAFFLL